MRNQVSFLLLAFSLLSSISIQSQICIADATQSERFKNSTVYFVFPDSQDEELKPYIEIIKDVWNISKTEIIDSSEIRSHLKNDAFFMYVDFMKYWIKDQQLTAPALRLWYVSDFKRNKNAINYTKNDIAYIFLFADSEKNMGYTNEFASLTDGTFLNTKPGFFKNYLQCVNDLLTADKKFGFCGQQQTRSGFFSNKSQMKNLKHDTLFVPKYVLNETIFKTKLSGTTSTTIKNPATEIFKDYQFRYKMISDKKLSEKIMDGDTPFYYLMSVWSGISRYICIMNAQTGEMIYCDIFDTGSSGKNRALKSSDITDLSKAISSAK